MKTGLLILACSLVIALQGGVGATPVLSRAEINGIRGPSTDAVDLDGCQNVVVTNVAMNVNDDAWQRCRLARLHGLCEGTVREVRAV